MVAVVAVVTVAAVVAHVPVDTAEAIGFVAVSYYVCKLLSSYDGDGDDDERADDAEKLVMMGSAEMIILM